MAKTPVASSCISSVAYSADDSLDIEFSSGAIYRYFAVPRSVLEALLAAPSKGAYVNKFIRDRFQHARLRS
jgi:hypothetical protein